MGDSATERPQPRSIPQLNTAAVGMAIVALVCASSGLVYGSGKLLYGSGEIPNPQQILYVVAFYLLTIPYFFYREAFVEEPAYSARDQSNNTFMVFFFAGLLAIIVLLLLALTGIHPREAIHLTFLMGISLFSFGYIGLRSHFQLKKGGAAARTERLFKNKVLLPAFATCLVSFSFGWSIAHPEWEFICVGIPVGLIVLLKEMTLRIPALHVSVIVGIFFLSLFNLLLLYRLGGYEFAKVLIIGIILTFAMGVAEVCKRVVRFHKRLGENSIEPYKFYYAGSNWASIVFPLLVCFLPLFVDDLPVWPIFILLSIQYLHWNHWTKERISPFLLFFNTVLGFLLPIFVCLQYIFPIKPAIGFGAELFDRLFGFTVAIMAVVIGLVAFFGKDASSFFRNAIGLKLESYSEDENCFFLFLFANLFTLLGVYLYGILAPPFFEQPLIGSKAAETALYLLLLLLVATGMYWYNNLDQLRSRFSVTRSDAGDPEASDSVVEIKRKNFSSVVVLFLRVGRLPVGLIAAVPVFLIVVLHTGASWLLALAQMVPICCITMAGFALNDLYDLEKDSKAGTDKPLIIGSVNQDEVRLFVWYLSALGLVIAATVSHGNSVLIIEVTLFGVAVYSWCAQKVPVLKGAATAVLCCAPFAYAAEISGIHFRPIFYAFLLIFIFGRELLLDVKDFAGDQKAGIITIVAYLGRRPSQSIGWLLMVGSLTVVALYSGGIARQLFLITIGSLGACFLIYLRSEQKGLAWSRITLLCGVIGTALSV
jgi:4-hydroxybenzoate polyprenyltransferase